MTQDLVSWNKAAIRASAEARDVRRTLCRRDGASAQDMPTDFDWKTESDSRGKLSGLVGQQMGCNEGRANII